MDTFQEGDRGAVRSLDAVGPDGSLDEPDGRALRFIGHIGQACHEAGRRGNDRGQVCLSGSSSPRTRRCGLGWSRRLIACSHPWKEDSKTSQRRTSTAKPRCSPTVTAACLEPPVRLHVRSRPRRGRRRRPAGCQAHAAPGFAEAHRLAERSAPSSPAQRANPAQRPGPWRAAHASCGWQAAPIKRAPGRSGP